MEARGDFIDGRFVPPAGKALRSLNPARQGEVVLETAVDAARIDAACDAAATAQAGWLALPASARAEHLSRFRAALEARQPDLADAIVLETGKIRAEGRGEAASLVRRFALVQSAIETQLRGGPVAGHPGESLRYHPLGVVGVIGPFNYPLHLCHAYVLPALYCGNTVVVKPSEITPLSAQRYAEAALDANLPPGVLNIVQGGGASGAALCEHSAVRGICFTGSWNTGRRLREQLLDRPDVLLSLEMGGKNTAVVLDDADIRQAAHEIVVGGFLTTGQRCTATDRVLCAASKIGSLVDALLPMIGSISFGDPENEHSFAGPLTTAGQLENLAAMTAEARDAGADVLVDAGAPSGQFVSPSLHRLPAGVHHIAGYTDVESFGPDLCIDSFEDDDEAIAILQASPFGLANSVFTASDRRFDRFYRRTHSGILNRNRGTNMASPRLPFGGLGKSGNYRPAGAFAPRNVTCAVAVQENVIGRVTVHEKLLGTLPKPDLDRMEAQHVVEEEEEAQRSLIDTPRPRALGLPTGGSLPASDSWLTRLYAGNRVVREKKPGVFDHLRSSGPFMVSVDDEPLSVLDGMSQTATLCGGFAEDPVVKAYLEGDFGDAMLTNIDTSLGDCEAASAYADVLRHLVPGLPHVTFANSGAEANEKALALCRRSSERRGADRVLAFEGGFHGRTLLALHATYNPKKRERYQIAGHEAGFVPFPVWHTPSAGEPAAPSGFYASAGHGDLEDLVQRFGDAEEDELLASEAASLVAVGNALATGDYFACIVEPMQSEGGDRYATARFHRALRLLTRHYNVDLIYDEVQTGFGLGGAFAWHSQFRLVDVRGQPDYPDAVTFAKRAQVGVCMSQYSDPERTPTSVASLIRGRIHAEMMSTAHAADRIEALVAPRLESVASGFPHLVGNPRGKGYAFAFDLPTGDHLRSYLGQRFWRGAVVFGAGQKTVRYRLSESYSVREIETLFDTIRRSLAWLEAHPGATPPKWEDFATADADTRPHDEVRIRNVGPAEAIGLLPAILDIEYRVYEPARRTPPGDIRAALEDEDGIVTVAELSEAGEWHFVGFGIGHPLERAAQVEEGPDRDPMLGKNNTLYSLSITVAPEYQGRGLGRKIKIAQLREAAVRKDASGAPRYRFVSGRNRVGHTPRMTRLNRMFGAHMVDVLTGQYLDPEGQAVYYRIPLPPLAPTPVEPNARKAPPKATIDMAQGICRPLSEPPESLVSAQQNGLLYGPTVNKITVMNYATPALVRALEWVSALLPTLPHLYLTSCRDETVDKTLRILRYHRKDAAVAITFGGSYFGHTSAAARSLSDPAVHRQGQAVFDWPRVPHPADVGVAPSIDALREAIAGAGGADRVFGIFFEFVQERTGRAFPDEFWPALDALRAESGVPLVAVETASACYRSGLGAFATNSIAIRPDVLSWWGGSQTGYLHVASPMWVSAPLTMVSTWDGDELSLVREQHQLRAARKLDIAAGVRAIDAAVAEATSRGVVSRGLGLYRVLDCGERAGAIHEQLTERGLTLRAYPGGRLALSPALDQAESAGARLAQALTEVL